MANLTNYGWRPNSYLHFFYEDFVAQGGYRKFYTNKALLLTQQKAELAKRQRAQARTGGDTSESLKMLKALTTPGGEKQLSAMLSDSSIKDESPMSVGSYFPMGGGPEISFQTIATRVKENEQEAQNFINNLGDFQKGVEKLLNDSGKNFIKESYSSIAQLIIEDQIAKGNLLAGNDNEIAVQVLNKFSEKSKKSGFFYYPEGSAVAGKRITTALAKLIVMNEALKQPKAISSIKTIPGGSEILSSIAEKVYGWISGCKGFLSKYAVEVGVPMIMGEFLGDYLKLDSDASFSALSKGASYIKIKHSPETIAAYKALNKTLYKSRRSKEDVSLTIDNKTFRLTIPFSIKSHRSGDLGVNAVNILTGSPLIMILSRSGLIENNAFMNALINTAAGKDKPGTASNITKDWQDIQELIKLSGALFALSGSGFSGDRALFMVVNHKVYGMETLLDKIYQNTSLLQMQPESMDRDQFVKLNKWSGDPAVKSRGEALGRSMEVKTNIYQSLYRQKLTFSLMI